MSAADECSSGTLTLVNTDATIAASLSVHPPCVSPTVWSVSEQAPINTREHCTHVEQGEHDTLEERRGFVQRALERLVQVRAELACILARRGLLEVRAHKPEHDALEVHACLLRLHVRDEDTRRGVRGLGRPLLGRGEREDACPCGERRDDFERLGKRAGAVTAQELTDSARTRTHYAWVP